MPLYEISGTSTGTAVTGPPVTLNHFFLGSLMGSSAVTGDTQSILNLSGWAIGAGLLVDARLSEITGTTAGSSAVSGDLHRTISFDGYSQGMGIVFLSIPDLIHGVAIVSAYMDVINVPLPLCTAPTVSTSFRWGHTFVRGDLTLSLADNRGPFGPVCISYTLYQMQYGCELKQIGPSGRKPGSSGVGCYYVTGTAGECGQPGLWAVKWKYQRTSNSPVIEKTCYFQVLDAVLSPVAGDNLERFCKYGWS